MRAFFLEQEQAFLRYVDLPGAEPPCVFIHGALDSSIAGMAMTAAQPALSTRRRILVDLLGYGLSDRPQDVPYSLQRHGETTCELLDALNVKGCQMIGHSMGATIAVVVASERPDLVSDLVLAEGGFPDGPQGFAAFADGKTEEEYAEWFTRFISDRLEDAKHEDNVLRIHIGMAQTAAPWAVYRTSRSLNAGDLQPNLRERFLSASMSKAYFVGGQSELDEEDDVLRADLEAAGGDWVVVPDAEHQMNFDNPEGFAEALAKRI